MLKSSSGVQLVELIIKIGFSFLFSVNKIFNSGYFLYKIFDSSSFKNLNKPFTGLSGKHIESIKNCFFKSLFSACETHKLISDFLLKYFSYK